MSTRLVTVHHVPVVIGQKLVGIVSNSDVLRVSFGDAFHTDERTVDATLTQLMENDPASVRESAPFREAAQILSQGNFHSLPVVAEGNRLVGIVTSTDLIHYLVAQS